MEANAAFLNSSFESPDGVKFDMPGTSDLTYNAAISYENYNVSVRLSYRYRDSWLDITENDTRDGVYWDAQDRLELSLRYDLEEMTGVKAIVYADFNNLNDATDIRYTGNAGNPNQVESYGKYRFKQGDLVVPGEVGLNKRLDFVKLSSVSEVAVNVDGEIISKPNFIKFKTGQRVKHWSKNCVAI